MRNLYGDAVVFAESYTHVVEIVKNLLSNATLLQETQSTGKRFIDQQTSNIYSVCRALSDLQKKLLAHSRVEVSFKPLESPSQKKKRKYSQKQSRKFRPIPPSPSLP
mmetsp:Transcript_24568/g.36182  ORF Transcript_24568/g.36182 Transcript_24568/m.36182 type:complete len:107 (-) Transcript_24568:147-467(-)